MKTSARIYHCHRCHSQVIICRRCDRGQRYCTKGCSQLARKVTCKRAMKKYQSSRQGKLNNAARQCRFRRRLKQKVTHHCSIQVPLHGVLINKARGSVKANQIVQISSILRCHHCNEICGPFLRHDFLQRTQFKRPFRRKMYDEQ
jgi:hypothetical protein